MAPCEVEGRVFRISAGLEDVDDLIDDLKRGFAALRAVLGEPRGSRAGTQAHVSLGCRTSWSFRRRSNRLERSVDGRSSATCDWRNMKGSDDSSTRSTVLRRCVDIGYDRIARRSRPSARWNRHVPADAGQRARNVGVGSDRHPRVFPDQVQHPFSRPCSRTARVELALQFARRVARRASRTLKISPSSRYSATLSSGAFGCVTMTCGANS